MMLKNHLFTVKRIAGFLLAMCILGAALFILYDHTRNLTWAMLAQAMAATPSQKILLSIVATLVSFMAMAANELIAVRTLTSRKASWRATVLAGMVGNALGNTLGFHTLTMSAWRYKVYAKAGLNVVDIAAITAITFMGIIMGFMGTAASAFLLDSHIHWLAATGLSLLLILFLGWLNAHPRHLRFKRWSFSLPGAKASFLQLIAGMADLLAAIYCAYVLLPADIAPSYAHFSLFYMATVLFGIASHTPGGLGVFEAGMMMALAANGRADVLAALLLYRFIYNLVPFSLACLVAGIHTWRRPLVR